MQLGISLFLFMIGACLGSFAYALTYRLHHKLNWVSDRSRCDHCKHVLAWYNLVPVISWLMQRGRCSYCLKKMGATYFVVELVMGIALASSYIFWPKDFNAYGIVQFSVWAVLLTILCSLFIFDLKWYILPNRLVAAATACAVFLLGIGLIENYRSWTIFGVIWTLLAALLSCAVGGGLFYLMYVVSNGRFIGGGDVKYGIFFGLLMQSAWKSVLVISLASLIGTLVLLPAMITRSRKLTSKVPFGPFLIIATIIVYLFGSRLIDIYSTTFLFP